MPLEKAVEKARAEEKVAAKEKVKVKERGSPRAGSHQWTVMREAARKARVKARAKEKEKPVDGLGTETQVEDPIGPGGRTRIVGKETRRSCVITSGTERNARMEKSVGILTTRRSSTRTEGSSRTYSGRKETESLRVSPRTVEVMIRIVGIHHR